MADNISIAIYNNGDIESVGQAIPTFLVLIDSMIEGSPESTSLLRAGAQLNDAYAGSFVEQESRKKLISDKALGYARKSACFERSGFCDLDSIPFTEFESRLKAAGAGDIPAIYTLAVTWLNWIQIHSDDWSAVTGLARVERLLDRVVELDDAYDNGMAHLYLGGIAALLPPALGGKPEVSREHFEKAIEISEGKNLMAKVVYAQMYARMMFDEDLHQTLLQDVLGADPDVPNFVLMNHLAQRQAAELMASAPDYF
ncbi:MAG: TRAP transporter TatT component family protein [Pseudomonadales bacterium]